MQQLNEEGVAAVGDLVVRQLAMSNTLLASAVSHGYNTFPKANLVKWAGGGVPCIPEGKTGKVGVWVAMWEVTTWPPS